MRSLLIGCGKTRVKALHFEHTPGWVGELTTMDVSPSCGADIVFDMDEVAVNRGRMPFDDEVFDEISSANAMEHWGRQGDWKGWFWECSEYWRILKTGGHMFILVPIGEDAFADPGHTRFFHANSFGFLSQDFYNRQEILDTCFSDYRWAWKKDFDVVYIDKSTGHHLAVILRKKAVPA